jgi:hypothetical protein
MMSLLISCLMWHENLERTVWSCIWQETFVRFENQVNVTVPVCTNKQVSAISLVLMSYSLLGSLSLLVV